MNEELPPQGREFL